MPRPDQSRSTLGQVMKTINIGAANKQVLQSMAGAFPCNSLLHKWGMVSSAACALCGALAETQSHFQSLPFAWGRLHPGMPLKDCPDEEDLNILTDNHSPIVLHRSMQRKDLPLWFYRHTVRQLQRRLFEQQLASQT